MNNEEYWRQRFKQLETLTYNKSQEYYKRIVKSFNATETKIKQIINEFYSRFASLEDISISEARKVLEADELEAFHMSVEQYVQYGIENNEHWNPDIDKLMEEASIKYRVTRLEAAFYQFAGEIGMLTGQEIGELYSLLGDVYIDRYYRTAFEVFQNYGVGTSFEMIDMNRLEMILDQPWAVDGTNFSTRLWTQQTKLVNQLSQALTQACVRGEGYTETIEYLAQAMNTSKSNAGRLVVTESAYFASRAQNSCFEELGAEQYEIIATLDNITDPECQDLDGQVYDMSEFQVGITAPPFHPNCRCTTAPYFDDSDIPGYVEGTRTARDPDGKTYRIPKNMKYPEWREKYNINPKYGTSENAPEPEENSSIVLERPNNQSTINSNRTNSNANNSSQANERLQLGDAYDLSIKELFEVGRFKNKLNKEQQGKHILGTKRYVEGSSYFENSFEELSGILKELVGTGNRVLTNKRKPTNKERVRDARIKGIYISKKYLSEKPSNKIIISHSKTGYHAYPADPDE